MYGFIRLEGSLLMIGGLLATLGWTLFTFFDPDHSRYESRFWIFSNMLIIFGGLSMAMGLPGFYLAQAERVGSVGVLGFIILFIGIVIPYVSVHSIETATSPNIPLMMRSLVRIGAPSLFIGAILMGIVTYISGIYPKWLGVGLILAILLGLIPQVRRVPEVYSRGLIPGFSTVVFAIIGFYTAFLIPLF